jgi:hypothetical protein
MDHIVDLVVGLFVIMILAAAVLPTAITGFVTTNTTGWDSGTKAVWANVPVFAVIGLMLGIIGIALYAYKKKR